MDTTRTKPPARNGSGLRPGQVVQGPAKVVGALGSRAPSICPYRLGAACPLVEVVQGNLNERVSKRRRANYIAISLGLILSIVAIKLIHL